MTKDKTEWWESDGGFFGDLYKEADNSYEGHLNNPSELSDRTIEEIEGVMRLCEISEGSKLLDCPCGYGRHSLALAQRGVDVTGADINKRFLELDNEALTKLENVKCKFIEKDMRKVGLENEFDAVINMFYSFGFFEDEADNVKVAEEFCKALKPGGKFLMHTHVTIPRLASGKLLNKQTRKLKSGNNLELTRTFNESTRREDGVWTVVSPEGKRHELTPYSVRLYTPEEFEDLCLKAGFSKMESFGDWQGNPYTDDSDQLITVATK